MTIVAKVKRFWQLFLSIQFCVKTHGYACLFRLIAVYKMFEPAGKYQQHACHRMVGGFVTGELSVSVQIVWYVILCFITSVKFNIAHVLIWYIYVVHTTQHTVLVIV